MAINRIKNRIDFGRYCLRKLGDPVVKINVSKEQVDDAIDDALDMFWEYHDDGSSQKFYSHAVTQEEIDSGIIKVPDGTLSVIRLLSLGGAGMGAGANGIATLDNLQYYAYFSDLISRIPAQGVSSYVMNVQYLNMIQDIFNAEKLIEFNKHTGTFDINGTRNHMREGDYIVYESVRIIDPEEHPSAWNTEWLKLYATALIKKTWGGNLSKYTQVTLPGGVTLNGDKIIDQAIEEIAVLEERLRDEFQAPPDFFVG